MLENLANSSDLTRVLAAYPADCQPTAIESLGGHGGFSGARLWRLATSRGPLCLRLWPPEYPTAERLRWIDHVLWGVAETGFPLTPAPIKSTNGEGFLELDGRLWEISPWLPGKTDFAATPSDAKLVAAMTALAQFHQAARSAEPPTPPAVSPGILQRAEMLRAILRGELDALDAAMDPAYWPEAADRGRRLTALARRAAPAVTPMLEAAAQLQTPMQPCLRDVWRENILFDGDAVSGIVDFASMRIDTVATDVARLLGSLAEDDARAWRLGREAYESKRPLSDTERTLVTAFDQANVVLNGLNWLRWIFVERRVFEDRRRVLSRLDEILARSP